MEKRKVSEQEKSMIIAGGMVGLVAMGAWVALALTDLTIEVGGPMTFFWVIGGLTVMWLILSFIGEPVEYMPVICMAAYVVMMIARRQIGSHPGQVPWNYAVLSCFTFIAIFAVDKLSPVPRRFTW